MAQRLVILGCGSSKRSIPSPAHQLYIGPYFKGNLAWAQSVVGLDQIYILSALHGFVSAVDMIEPYDLRMGKPGSVQLETLQQQAAQLDFADRDVVAICGQDYLKKLEVIFPKVKVPCRGLAIGKSLRMLKMNKGKWP